MNRKSKSTFAIVSVTIVVTWVALCLTTGINRVNANTFTVTNTGDNVGVNPAPGAGTGTLRQAIIDANATAGADTISFAEGVTGTITLASALPQITHDVTINGPGAGVLTVSGANLYRVFDILSDVTDVIVTISGLTISNGKSDSGGGILNGGKLTLTNSTFSSNSATFVGGGILSGGTLTVTNSTFSGNSASRGGAIESVGTGGIDSVRTLTVTNSTFSGNSASSGGAIESVETLTVTNSTFSGNSGFQGGGIVIIPDVFHRGTATVTNSTISGNSADFGGGIYVDISFQKEATLTVTNSTFSSNTATFGGGGIFNNSMLTVSNSTFSGNSAANYGGGGIQSVGTLTVTNSTFLGNSGNSGGGISNFGAATSKNSIIGNSPTGGNYAGTVPITAVGVNFSTDNTCAGFIQVTAQQLNLGPLQDNGGPTFTHALLPGSAAIDAVTDCTDLSATPTPVTTDQRGFTRPQDGDGNGSVLCDAGAFELQPCVITCPANITQANDTGRCGAVVNYGDVGCGTVTCSPTSGSSFPVGTTTVTCSEPGGATCSFTVTVNDTQPPTITCPANVTAVTAVLCPPTTSTAVTFPTPTPSDNCPGVTVACKPPSGSILPVGTTTVTCIATDATGNTASCSFSLTVFNGRLQDDSNPNNVLLFNTATGDYALCCGGTVFRGRALALLKGCVFTLQHYPTDRRFLVNVDFSQKIGTASLQFPPGTMKCTIIDRNMADDTSTCP